MKRNGQFLATIRAALPTLDSRSLATMIGMDSTLTPLERA